MHRICALLAAAFLALAWQAPAAASGDYGCSPSWKLKHRDMSGCDDMAVLGPANDTRVNLSLLLLDRRGGRPRGTPPALAPTALFDWRSFSAQAFPGPEQATTISYAEGEGSRCRSNDSGIAAFAAAVNGTPQVPEEERQALIAARRAFKPSCTEGSGEAPIAMDGRIRSAMGKAFAVYLRGASAFYAGDYDAAAASFAALRSVGQPWLKETASYMIGRIEVNRAQIDAFDDYGYPKGAAQADRKALADAEAGLRAYLRSYPGGLYAASARGLLRRVYWLGGDTDRLTSAYVEALGQAGGNVGDLADEIDNKLLPGLIAAKPNDPILLAVLDLQRMREGAVSPITRAEIEAQRPHFSGDAALFDYLLAAYAWFVEDKPDAVLKLIPDAARQKNFSYLQFSRQMLRGAALDALGDRNARGFWLEMISGTTQPFQRPAAELALALHDERNGKLDGLFDAASPVRTPAIREILLTKVAGPALLRRQAKDSAAPRHERDVALFVLLYKNLTRGAYRDFVADEALVPAGGSTDGSIYDLVGGEQPPIGIFSQNKSVGDYDCPALKAVARQLAAEPRNATALLCLADFMRVTGFDDYALDQATPGDELGGTASRFAGPAYFSRLDLYRAIIADAKAPAPDKAYALYRAINCYATSGNNSCGSAGVPIAQRKAWFQRLKKDYPASRWAQELRYYW